MNAPVVTILRYDLNLSTKLEFENPPALERELKDFKFILNNGVLEITMKTEAQTERAARNLVEPYLKSWELGLFLNNGHRDFWFEFKNSEIVDKDPSHN